MSKILIVEDSATFRQSLKDFLLTRLPSLVIEEASDGREVLRKVNTFYPHLIFMDIHLPGENGLRLTRRIKRDHSRMPIIIFTSYNLPEYRNAAIEAGADHFVPKELCTGKEILALVESILSDQDFDHEDPHAGGQSG
jgi:DNA-binding NarL/FixJ family response regulator